MHTQEDDEQQLMKIAASVLFFLLLSPLWLPLLPLLLLLLAAALAPVLWSWFEKQSTANAKARAKREAEAEAEAKREAEEEAMRKRKAEREADLKLVQEWITQLPEIDETTKRRICSAFRKDLVDVEALVELSTDDFLRLGVSKIGWQKKLLRQGKQEMELRSSDTTVRGQSKRDTETAVGEGGGASRKRVEGFLNTRYLLLMCGQHVMLRTVCYAVTSSPGLMMMSSLTLAQHQGISRCAKEGIRCTETTDAEMICVLRERDVWRPAWAAPTAPKINLRFV